MVLRLVPRDESDDDDAGEGRDREADAAAAGQTAPIGGSHTVTYTGRLAFLTHDEFVGLAEQHGARYVPPGFRPTSILVVGQQDWALRPDGTLPPALAGAGPGPQTMVVSEERFLHVLGIEPQDRGEPELYTTETLSRLLQVSRERLRAWVNAGLIQPKVEQYGVMKFEFRQVSVAKLLWDLSRAGVPTGQVRRSLEQLRRWMPDVQQPLEQLAILEQCGRLLVRLEEGLVEPDGQFHFDFTDEPQPTECAPTMSIGPHGAAEWFAQGQQQESHGFPEEAVASYRQALMKCGPDAAICYNLARVLVELGRREQACERFRQAVEIDPRFADAWNNLGMVLTELGEREEACLAFRRALAIDAQDLRARFNLADTLDELGRGHEARQHWRDIAEREPTSERGRYARSRLA